MRVTALSAVALCLGLPTFAYAQINWHAPRAAGRVWEDKIDENNRQDRQRTAEQRAQAAAADAAWEAPLSTEDLQGTLSHNRDEYERQLRLGKGFADNWLDRTARMERFKRDNGGNIAATSAAPRAIKADANCSADALPIPERRQMETEYVSRFKNDGRASADAWAQEQGRRFRKKLQGDGIC